MFMAQWAKTLSGRLGVIMYDNGGTYFVKPFDSKSPDHREEWPYSDIKEIIDEKKQALRRLHNKAGGGTRKKPQMSFVPPSRHGACPDCQAPFPTYVSGVACPNCGFSESTKFKDFMMQFEWIGFRSRI